MSDSVTRSPVIDVAKGLSIALVAFGHSELPHHLGAVNGALAVTRMPLFFVLAGATLATQTPFGEFAARKTVSLLRPYALVALALIFLAWFQAGQPVLWEAVRYLWATGLTVRWMPMWFLPHLWLVVVALRWALPHCKAWMSHGRWHAGLLVGLTWATGMAVVELARQLHFGQALVQTSLPANMNNPGWPLSADLLLLSCSYVLAGYALRHPLRSFVPRWGGLLLAGLVWGWVVCSTDAAINFSERVFHRPLFAWVGSMAGIYLLMSLAWCLHLVPRVQWGLIRLARASLYILILHAFISGKSFPWLHQWLGGDSGLWAAWLAWALSIAVPLLLHEAVGRLVEGWQRWSSARRAAAQPAEAVDTTRLSTACES
jgi:fucose 4-O-acetylase-like acetyltransferase